MLAFQFDWTMNMGQVIQTLSVLIAFAGLLITFREIRRTSKVHTAQVLKDVIFTFFSDPEIQRTFYRIGSGSLRFDRAKFDGTGSEDERALDQLLYVFECVGRLHSLGLITPDDLLLRYRMVKVFQDPEVLAYLRYLDDEVYPRKLGKGAKAFRNARELVRVLSEHATEPPPAEALRR